MPCLGYNETYNHAPTHNKGTDTPSKYVQLMNVERQIEGVVTAVGDQAHPSIYIKNNYGCFEISVGRDVLASLADNILHKIVRIAVTCKYDRLKDVFNDYKFKEFVKMPELDEQCLDAVIRCATADWKGVSDPYTWLVSLRGGDA